MERDGAGEQKVQGWRAERKRISALKNVGRRG